MKTALAFFLVFSLLAFAAEKYGVYDLQGNRISTFEAESHELLEKARQAKSNNLHKKLYVSSLKKGKAAKPDSRYLSKTGAYIEASRNETFSICPVQEIEGTWISEHSVSLNEKNCLSVQAPDLAGTFRILFMENSGLTDTIQVLVEQSYIQMGDYSHIIFVADSNKIKAGLNDHPKVIYRPSPGNYESRSYSQSLVVDKTKFTMGDAQYYFKVGNIETIDYPSLDEPYLRSVAEYWNKKRQEPYKGQKLEGSRFPLVNHNGFAWRLANERSKKEGLDTAYYVGASGALALDTSASGYRLPLEDEWFFLMRAGASTRFYWGNESDPYGEKEDSLKISRYAWINPFKPVEFIELKPFEFIELKPVAQLLPNEFGLYDMIGIAIEEPLCRKNYLECFLIARLGGSDSWRIGPTNYESFRLLRKTPKLHKLEKF